MKFRKKPVVIEAIQFNGENFDEIAAFMGQIELIRNVANRQAFIRTLEGEMTASEGDYIIKGGKGEFYPCKPEIFAATYEQAE